MRPVLIDGGGTTVLRIQVDRDTNGAPFSALVTVFDQDGSRNIVLDAEGIEQAAEALCAPTPGNA